MLLEHPFSTVAILFFGFPNDTSTVLYTNGTKAHERMLGQQLKQRGTAMLFAHSQLCKKVTWYEYVTTKNTRKCFSSLNTVVLFVCGPKEVIVDANQSIIQKTICARNPCTILEFEVLLAC